jgi:hypothetical protein
MSSDRIVLVGVIWTLLLLGLLVLRELLRASGRTKVRWVLPTLNVLIVVMIGAATLTAVLRLTSIGGAPTTAVGANPSPTPAAVALSATPHATMPAMSLPVLFPASPSASPTPSPTVRPTPSPTPVPTPSPTPVPTVAPTPATGLARLPATFTAYQVSGDSVTGYRTVRGTAGFRARVSAPQACSMPTLSDPGATRRLVRILSGPFAGTWVSPQDAGVSLVLK